MRAERQYDGAAQEEIASELAGIFATRPLGDWLDLFDGEEVCVGPVATLAEAAVEFGTATQAKMVPLGAHTDAWRAELGL